MHNAAFTITKNTYLTCQKLLAHQVVANLIFYSQLSRSVGHAEPFLMIIIFRCKQFVQRIGVYHEVAETRGITVQMPHGQSARASVAQE
ncbi:hypothetical protein GCM10011400_22730 [Paraburkholderia caffeinilytica]|uniref:Uncharacterized protein n=1 Tax=Paraburkholderia caffeinilytica TaxID=1761016 RepID=A0ABQ1M6M4_9BURK|nr:hypothetical protein GCM10011400_22730 [Paraburkholderia caffeinilytica]